MRFLIGVLFIGLLVSMPLVAQTDVPFTEFKFGFLDPEDTGSGNLIGISTGRRIDNRLFWGLEVNYFRTVYQQVTTIADTILGGAGVKTKQLELKFTTTVIPIFLKLDYELKLGPRSPFYFRASGALGWELIWNNENNFLLDIERTRFFQGLGWQLTTGLGIRISDKGLLFVDAIYNNAVASRNRERNELGLPIFQEIDVSGFGFKAGINIVGLGF
ncbi:MAG: hypothetical protein D6681_00030 [Calditrichaeota bacterium]|nr:MAG: hypothetical protein D6681_00030 [Calditrichota bacterium]